VRKYNILVSGNEADWRQLMIEERITRPFTVRAAGNWTDDATKRSRVVLD